jgi:hypothetical protein
VEKVKKGVDKAIIYDYIGVMKAKKGKTMQKLTKKQTKKIRDQIIIDFLDKHMSKFDRLMNNASKELGTLGLKCSIHALSSQIIKHIATNMANYYGTTEKVKDTFQTALEEEANHRYIHAKMDREEAQLN